MSRRVLSLRSAALMRFSAIRADLPGPHRRRRSPVSPHVAVMIATNQSNCPPLEQSHVRSIAKSVTRYRARWIAAGAYYTQEQKTLWGRERQRRGVLNRRRRQGLDARDAAIIQAVERGESMRSVAAGFGLTEGAVRYIVRRGVRNLLHR